MPERKVRINNLKYVARTGLYAEASEGGGFVACGRVLPPDYF